MTRRYKKASYLAGKNKKAVHKPIFKGDAKKHRVNQIMDMLTDWRITPFENEGAIQAGIRSTLCLNGYPWQASQNEASLLINEAFKNLGIARPTWEQGQPSYTEPYDTCLQCKGKMPDELITTGKRFRYCSVECAKAAIENRNELDKRAYNKIHGQIERLLHKRNMPTHTCRYCNVGFKPTRGAEGFFCSPACANKSRKTIPERPCVQCGKIFKPRKNVVKFCSMACVKASRPNHMANCDYCGKEYLKRVAHARFCSITCRQYASDIKQGRDIPKKLTPPVFHYFFARKINARFGTVVVP